MQYYYCSRARRGLEYHLSARAVKFILDQAAASVTDLSGHEDKTLNAAQAAASALRKILTGDGLKEPGRPEESKLSPENANVIDPLSGWSDGVSLHKSHCCLLLKPQVVLRTRGVEGETCIVAAIQAKLQSFAIMDDANADDPVSGKVMSRYFVAICFSCDHLSVEQDLYATLWTTDIRSDKTELLL